VLCSKYLAPKKILQNEWSLEWLDHHAIDLFKSKERGQKIGFCRLTNSGSEKISVQAEEKQVAKV
jgi:hypothetical protein